jgi:hypothetical protein
VHAKSRRILLSKKQPEEVTPLYLMGHPVERRKEKVLLALMMVKGEALQNRLLIKETYRTPPPIDETVSHPQELLTATEKHLDQLGVLTRVELLGPAGNAPGPPIDWQQNLFFEPHMLVQGGFIPIEMVQCPVSPDHPIRVWIEQCLLMEQEELVQSLVQNLQG